MVFLLRIGWAVIRFIAGSASAIGYVPACAVGGRCGLYLTSTQV
jgi:hypothetical protein